MGGKWPSGRRRQTVNLLGNSRWFESNLSHFFMKVGTRKIALLLNININNNVTYRNSITDKYDNRYTDSFFFKKDFMFLNVGYLKFSYLKKPLILNINNRVSKMKIRKEVINKVIIPQASSYLKLLHEVCLVQLNQVHYIHIFKMLEKL